MAMKKEISESSKISAGNLMEEASATFEECSHCGLCKSNCGVFKILKEEHLSPRGQGDLLRKGIMDKILFECNLCKACEESCPLDLKICEAILKAREAMVLLGKGLKENEKIARLSMDTKVFNKK